MTVTDILCILLYICILKCHLTPAVLRSVIQSVPNFFELTDDDKTKGDVTNYISVIDLYRNKTVLFIWRGLCGKGDFVFSTMWLILVLSTQASESWPASLSLSETQGQRGKSTTLQLRTRPHRNTHLWGSNKLHGQHLASQSRLYKRENTHNHTLIWQLTRRSNCSHGILFPPGPS